MLKGKGFRIGSLVAAGLFPGEALAAFSTDLNAKSDPSTLFEIFKRNQSVVISGHRSHSSHSSHGSHRSSSGGGYSVPSRVYKAPPVVKTPPVRAVPPVPAKPSAPPIADPATTYRSDSTSSSSVLPTPQRVVPNTAKQGLEDQLTQTLMRKLKVVQLALFSYGYYAGDVDGIMGPQTRVAISKFQTDYSLKVTGTITPELLNALGIHGQ